MKNLIRQKVNAACRGAVQTAKARVIQWIRQGPRRATYVVAGILV